MIQRAPIVLATAALLLTAALRAQDGKPDAAEPKPAPPGAVQLPKLPSIDINLEKQYVDFEAAVCLREGPLELIATVRSAKEHEAIVVCNARPQNIHLALLTLGLTPGTPGGWREKDDGKVEAVQATGDRVRVSLVIKDKDGKVTETPIQEFIHNPETKKTLPSSEFVFSGSRISKPKKGKPFYAADVAGNVISLVTFSDEMLAWPENASKANATLEWHANTDKIPPVGTDVTLRIRPVKAIKKPEAEKPKS